MYKKAILHFKTADPTLYEISKLSEEFELAPHPDPFYRLTRSIVGQQLSLAAARTIFARFENLFPNGKLNSEYLSKLSAEELRTAGLSFQKISYIKDLALKVTTKEIELGNFNDMTNEEITNDLIKIKGIGKWTAEMFLMFTLARPDVFSFGDLGLQNAIKKFYKLKNKPTIKQMEKLSKKWAPYRTYAALILWNGLDTKPA